MAHRKTLNEKRLAVLRWVADGCPAGVQEGNSHRITAAALRRRNLVRTSGRGSTWRAKITSTGRDYLERAAGPDPPVPRQPSVSVTEQLVDDVLEAGGSLRVPRRRYGDRGGVDFENRGPATIQRSRRDPARGCAKPNPKTPAYPSDRPNARPQTAPRAEQPPQGAERKGVKA